MKMIVDCKEKKTSSVRFTLPLDELGVVYPNEKKDLILDQNEMEITC